MNAVKPLTVPQSLALVALRAANEVQPQRYFTATDLGVSSRSLSSLIARGLVRSLDSTSVRIGMSPSAYRVTVDGRIAASRIARQAEREAAAAVVAVAVAAEGKPARIEIIRVGQVRIGDRVCEPDTDNRDEAEVNEGWAAKDQPWMVAIARGGHADIGWVEFRMPDGDIERWSGDWEMFAWRLVS